MLDIGWSELLLVAIVAVVVVGPKELPKLMRTFGIYAGKVRRMASDFQRQFNEAVAESEADEVRKNLEAIQSNMGPAPDLETPLGQPVMTGPMPSEEQYISHSAPQEAEPALPPAKDANAQEGANAQEKASVAESKQASLEKAPSKKAPAKKSAPKKATSKKTAPKKAVVRKSTSKKSASKKPAATRGAGQTAVAKKTAAKKTVTTTAASSAGTNADNNTGKGNGEGQVSAEEHAAANGKTEPQP